MIFMSFESQYATSYRVVQKKLHKVNDTIILQFLSNIACQNLLKSADVSWSYSKNKTGMFFMDFSVEGNTFLHSSISSGNNKEYLAAVFKY